MENIAIIGSGISGLMVAWACEQSSVGYAVYTDKVVKPKVAGFMYLHDACGMPLQQYELTQRIVPEGVDISDAAKFYSMRIYGTEMIGNSLPSIAENPVVKIWNMTEAVDHIWEHIEGKVKRKTFRDLDHILDFSEDYDLVFSTVPLDKMDKRCGVYFYNECYVETKLESKCTRNWVEYNGGDEHLRPHRWGCLFGHSFSESNSKPGKIMKKVAFGKNYPDVPENVILCGRYGAWDKTILVDDVYRMVREKLNG